ncbi:MAG: phospho-N-acetylmuramoyl-pentapeptide-transferase [Eubacteriaceae bacterium]|nr:phospho-N-acetylmuramoyl-pentapeptide-transferase [Eubacteriaceae bacterium]
MTYFMIIIPAVVGFIAAVILTAILIPVLKRQAGQNIREEGPEAHQAKAGTPSMGGAAIIVAAVIAFLTGWYFDSDGMVIMAGMILFGAIGFFDDWLKVIKKQNEGLKPWQKFGLQFIFAVLIAVYVGLFSQHGTDVFVPFAKVTVDFGMWYIPFIVFTILAMVNAVNLTDGLDGLASGTTAIVALYLLWLAYTVGAVSSAIAMAAIMGACLGFLVFNRNPAKVFMGDTGSLALGGVITAAAIVMKMELLLPIVGIVYVLEVLSVCMQVTYFKATGGKRIFKMTPLHHHFELSGMKETTVVIMFWGITFVFCILGFVIV